MPAEHYAGSPPANYAAFEVQNVGHFPLTRYSDRHRHLFTVVPRIEFQQKRHGGLGPFLGGQIIIRAAGETALQHISADDAGIQRHGGQPRRQFLRERLRQSFNRPFRGAIRRDFRVGRAAPAGTEIHDHAAAPRDHRRHKMADDVRHAFEIHVHHGGEFLGGNFPERRVAIDERGVVEQQIRRSVHWQNAFCPRRHLVIGRNIHDGKIVWRRKLSLQRGNFPGRTAAAEDGVAEPDEFHRHRAAKSARDAGDENRFHKARPCNRSDFRQKAGLLIVEKCGGLPTRRHDLLSARMELGFVRELFPEFFFRIGKFAGHRDLRDDNQIAARAVAQRQTAMAHAQFLATLRAGCDF